VSTTATQTQTTTTNAAASGEKPLLPPPPQTTTTTMMEGKQLQLPNIITNNEAAKLAVATAVSNGKSPSL
jgi:hypothetical protein